MTKLQTRAARVFDRILDGCVTLAAILLALLVLSVSYEVTVRQLFRSSLIGLDEVLEFSLLWIAFLTIAWVLKQEGHVSMDIIVTRFKPRTRVMLSILTTILSAVICFIIALYGTKITWDYFKIGYMAVGILYLPKWPIMSIIPVGFFLLFIQMLRRCYGFVTAWRALGSDEKKSEAQIPKSGEQTWTGG